MYLMIGYIIAEHRNYIYGRKRETLWELERVYYKHVILT